MLEEEFEREVKVLVVGNGGVGKTSMIRRFCKGQFTDEYKKTIGVDFLEKQQYVRSLGEEVKLMLWDTAGQEEFDAMTRTYYRGAGAAVLVFSSTDRASFEAVAAWKKKVEAECGDIAMALVQNKVDLLHQAVMTREEAEALASKVGLRFYRACVKENLNISEVFEFLAETAIDKEQQAPQGSSASARVHSIEKPKAPRATSLTHTASNLVGSPSSPATGGSAKGKGADTTINLKPTKQRTKGKKKLKDKMPDCSIL